MKNLKFKIVGIIAILVLGVTGCSNNESVAKPDDIQQSIHQSAVNPIGDVITIGNTQNLSAKDRADIENGLVAIQSEIKLSQAINAKSQGGQITAKTNVTVGFSRKCYGYYVYVWGAAGGANVTWKKEFSNFGNYVWSTGGGYIGVGQSIYGYHTGLLQTWSVYATPTGGLGAGNVQMWGLFLSGNTYNWVKTY